ncbi:MAG: metallopeptidase [Candidatus Aenigmarchaeota archaeon]|nr:metallopeptidase [Candidatus Aenigmarchaeota archaeon]
MMKFDRAHDIQVKVNRILFVLDLPHIDRKRVVCMRSWGSKSNAIARIWSMPRIWQGALGIKSHYVIEVISEKFDKLKEEEQERTLIHELMHIPKTFSGALVPHKCFGKKIDDKAVDKIYKEYKKRMKEFR